MISAALVLVGIYLSGYAAYWSILLVVHFCFRTKPHRKHPNGARFAVLVPAHDEELLLPRLLSSLSEQRYPRKLFETIVIADNCTDGTAHSARRAGVTVHERFDDTLRGKGYALKWALETIDLDRYDAVLIIDADCFLTEDSLASLAGRLHDAPAIQCYSGVGNPDESWFTRLLDVSRTINNDIYSPAKQRLGLSVQLIGTGMCLSTEILRQFGWDAFTVGEDCEYYAKLVRGGETVGFDWDAKVYHQESTSLRQATSQRMRWSSGRFAVAWKYGFNLLMTGATERNLVKFDAGLSLILPNPSLGMNLTLASLVASLLAEGGSAGLLFGWFLLLALAQLGLFVVGISYTRKKLSKFLAIFIAPAFLVWKMAIDALSVLGLGRKKWTRTERRL
jgi:1,2-diacylglycerol 3-beta-glucosyltransferase